MKLIITAKTGKGKNSSEKDIDKTVEMLEKFMLNKNIIDNFRRIDGKCMSDGTSLILEY